METYVLSDFLLLLLPLYEVSTRIFDNWCGCGGSGSALLGGADGGVGGGGFAATVVGAAAAEGIF